MGTDCVFVIVGTKNDYETIKQDIINNKFPYSASEIYDMKMNHICIDQDCDVCAKDNDTFKLENNYEIAGFGFGKASCVYLYVTFNELMTAEGEELNNTISIHTGDRYKRSGDDAFDKLSEYVMERFQRELHYFSENITESDLRQIS